MKNAPTTVGTESRAMRHKRMIAEMSNGRTLMWVGVAFVVHVVLILGTSLGFIHDNYRGWFGMKPAEQASTEDSGKSPVPATPGTPAAKPAASAALGSTDKPAATAQPPAAPTPAGLSDDDKKLSDRSNSPTVKNVTAAAKPNELPKGPQRNAFDLEETPK